MEGFDGFFGEIGVGIDTEDVREEGRGDGVAVGGERREEVMHEREVVGAAEFEDEGVEGRRGVAEVGVGRGG